MTSIKVCSIREQSFEFTKRIKATKNILNNHQTILVGKLSLYHWSDLRFTRNLRIHLNIRNIVQH